MPVALLSRNDQDAAGEDLGDPVEGDAAVFEPQGNDWFVTVARIPPENWSSGVREPFP
jgi:hypothetical protein